MIINQLFCKKKNKYRAKNNIVSHRFYYLLRQSEITCGLPSETCLREGLKIFILAIPGISVSMIVVEAIKNIEENESPFFPFSYCCKLRYLPLNSYITVKIASPVMIVLTFLELAMHILIQLLAHRLDSPRGEVIMAENEVITRRMHRRLVISETGCFLATIARVILIYLYHTFIMKGATQTLTHIAIFCNPSINFFVNPTILTVLSSDVRSSMFKCFIDIASINRYLRPN